MKQRAKQSKRGLQALTGNRERERAALEAGPFISYGELGLGAPDLAGHCNQTLYHTHTRKLGRVAVTVFCFCVYNRHDTQTRYSDFQAHLVTSANVPFK